MNLGRRTIGNKGIQNLCKAKSQYVMAIDGLAHQNATGLAAGRDVTERLVEQLEAIYKAAREERRYKDAAFESAYHTPVTGDFEFLVARTLCHYGLKLSLNWKVFLRRQVTRTAPDIRVTVGDRTLGIVEIKTKLGWMQPFFSSQQATKDARRLREGKSDFNPTYAIDQWREQLDKYAKVFKVRKECVFVLVPSLRHVHRKKHGLTLANYRQTFARNSGLPEQNLVLLSDDLDYDPGGEIIPLVTQQFEKMVKKLVAA